jgi:serine protease Do
MRVWKIAGGTVAALGACALVVAWTPTVLGQQTHIFKSGDDKEQHIVVQRGGPMALAQQYFSDARGVRIGVMIHDASVEEATTLKLASPGVVVDGVEKESPAAKGGVAKGDVVVSFDGEAVRSALQLMRLVRETAAGRTVKMVVTREGKRVELSVVPDVSQEPDWRARLLNKDDPESVKELELELQKHLDKGRDEGLEFRVRPHIRLPGFDEGAGRGWTAVGPNRGRLGVSIQSLTPELAEYFGVKAGVLITSVKKDSPAAKAGIKAGDVITALDATSVKDPSQLVEQLAKAGVKTAVTIVRDKKPLTLDAVIDAPEGPSPRPKITG